MAYDRPGNLGGGRHERFGGSELDSETRALLTTMYQPLDALSGGFDSATANGWVGGLKAGYSWKLNTKCTSNVMVGLNGFNIPPTANKRVNAYVTVSQPGVELQGKVETWEDTYLSSVSYDMLAFQQDDDRVQAGTVNMDAQRPAAMKMNPTQNEEYKPRINFKRPFNKTPRVVTCISSFDVFQGSWVRIEVRPDDIDCNGFTMKIGSWAG